LVLFLLVVGVTDAAQLTASWDDNSDGKAAFQLERRDASTPFTVIANVPAGFTSYLDDDVVAGLTYCYRIRAYTSVATSGYSPEACGIPTEAALAKQPSGLSVTVKKAGTGSGWVASSPPGIECGDACQEVYGDGRVVILVAAPEKGSKFDGWSGSCGSGSTCLLTGNGPISVTATFSRLRTRN
jgi:hypothetical protein